MVIPNHAIEIAVAQADSVRQHNKARWDEWVTIQMSFEHDWPAEALVQLVQRLREHYIELEIGFVHPVSANSQPTE